MEFPNPWRPPSPRSSLAASQVVFTLVFTITIDLHRWWIEAAPTIPMRYSNGLS